MNDVFEKDPESCGADVAIQISSAPKSHEYLWVMSNLFFDFSSDTREFYIQTRNQRERFTSLLFCDNVIVDGILNKMVLKF